MNMNLETSTLKEKEASNSRNITLFIVDDSLFTCARVIDIVSEVKGVEVAGISRNPKEALKRIRELEPEIVFIKPILARGSGVELLSLIKQGLPEIVTCILTDHNFQEDMERCIDLGADFFLEKTCDIDNFLMLYLKNHFVINASN